MKYALILPDGAADDPVEALDGRTPLEAAETPGMDWIAMNGRQGTQRTIPEGMPADSGVATLSVVGYDPKKCYPGRAPIEAAAQRIRLGMKDLVFRCNLVTIVDGKMVDFTAGHIRQEEAQRLIDELNERFGSETVAFHAGISYRHLMVVKEGLSGLKMRCIPPHDIPGERVSKHMPRGRGSKLIRQLMEQSQAFLGEHEVNQIRNDLGENPANSIWLWGQGGRPRIRRFADVYGVHAAAVGAVDIFRGLSTLLGWRFIPVEGATGYIDTNYQGKGAAAVAALDEHDMVVVHVEAPDEAGHSGDAEAKVKAIEQVDKHIVVPILDKLRGYGEDWRVWVAPDHPTPVATGIHTADPPPFCMAGREIVSVLQSPFSEASAAESDFHAPRGHELMEFFLKYR
ncbi:MAG: cofactor-independent phosphoglycerate mutase [Phycisphaerae bacterium]|nr:cofactor-independent phosphoglycerate mutase [Phycisphaerae bacterium]